MKIIIASNNPNKILELQKILSKKKIELIAQNQLNIPEIEETGSTFLENALLKAKNACVHSNLPAIADDSGLEVKALNNRPGIHSARYAHNNATYQENIAQLLAELKNVPKEQRTACFQCAIVFLRSVNDKPIICHGSWQGRITNSPIGRNGFGYDPIFWVPTHNCTSAQLPPQIKNKISARAKALEQLSNKLATEVLL